MNLSAHCIRRPVATTLLTLAITLSGLLAFFQLPVAPLPQVDFPTISVQASLPGASPETMAASVAIPLERALGNISDVTEITSTSSAGSTAITLQFDLNRDIDGAARDVQSAINAAGRLLPANMPKLPSYQKINPADSPIMILALTSDTLSKSQLYDIASTQLSQKISQIQGIGDVTLGGSALPAIRIALNPNALAHYGVGFEDVRSAIMATNVNRPKGALEDAEHNWLIDANDQTKTASDYRSLIITYLKGAAIRLADLGEAIDSVEDLATSGLKDGKQAVLLVLNKQAGANIIDTIDNVKLLIPELRASIPISVDLSVVSDRSITIRASLHEVAMSLLIAILLIIIVVFLFLGNIRASVIPIITVPVSLIGTFGVMYLLGYSLDNLSLMALTIATGFVVDDAIVVLENTSHHLEQGLQPEEAAVKGVSEVGFTVLTMSLSLIAVFIPILFMGGIVGRLFREFAVTLSVAVMISLVVSLTLTPMLCAFWLKSAQNRVASAMAIRLDRFNHRLLAYYKRSLTWSFRHGPLVMIILLCTVLLNIYLYTLVPKGFFPTQDTGRLGGYIQADQRISYQAMKEKLAVFIDILRQEPEIETVLGFTGGQRGKNMGVLFATLKPLAERKISINQLLENLRKKSANVPGARLILRPPQDIRIGGRGAPAMFEYALQSDQLSELRTWVPRIEKALSEKPGLVDVNSNQQNSGQQINLEINRDAAARLGISQFMIDSTLNNAFGNRQISIVYAPLNQYQVIMGVAPEYSLDPESLKNIYISVPPSVQNPTEAQVPLSAIASYVQTNTPLSINHQSQFPTDTISFSLNGDTKLSQATEIIHQTLQDLRVPATIHGSFQGTAKAFQQSTEKQPWLILAALISIYIVLGILYESYIHPLTILSTLPSAGVGAILTLLLLGTEFSLIAMIGVLLLIGIVKKNAILMIDFAIQAERTHNVPPEEAIFTACLQRFRPIMMTTFVALFAAFPLAIGTGYGAELRHPLGLTIMGGLLLSQVLTLYTTPVIYLYLDRWQTHLGQIAKKYSKSFSI